MIAEVDRADEGYFAYEDFVAIWEKRKGDKDSSKVHFHALRNFNLRRKNRLFKLTKFDNLLDYGRNSAQGFGGQRQCNGVQVFL